MKMKPLIISLAAAIALSGCQMTNTGQGAAIGAATGAVLGKATGNHKDKRIFIGAAIGAIAGAAIGDYMDKQEAEFRRELEGTGVDVVREGNNMTLVMPSNITFASNQASISPEFYNTLNGVAKVMNKYDKTWLTIIGHTDSTGASDYNQRLSEQRAMSVRNYLVANQVAAVRLQTQGMGESQPVASNQTEQGKAMNRRVEIQIIPNQK
ncbi:OmpA family protein [Pseudoalteromonas xiamenensis]|jgi:outer membrane protein OmpA-like peptidoglycan-associated protein|uniref:OmpA family protein n=1 Tax=Pseudoalteromonas xiamenensis TaxID=882626 RepID=A0A975DGI5_9GAMM|nr:OmpA family protein [Pseudoalteromonas xiamenensis]QTH70687.1 OmpA family protein [Pseudoalteromonas xiamenensis]